MKRIKQYFQEHIIVRFALITVIFILGIILVAQSFFEVKYVEKLQSEVMLGEQKSMENMAENFDIQIEPYLNTLYDVASDSAITNLIRDVKPEEPSNSMIKLQLANIFKKRILVDNNILALVAADEGGSSFGYDKSLFTQMERIWGNDSDEFAKEIYEKVVASGKVASFYSKKGKGAKSIVHFAVPVIKNASANKNTYQVLIMTVNMEFLYSAFEKNVRDNVNNYLIDYSGRIIMCGDEEQIGEMVERTTDQEKRVILEKNVNSLGWEIYTVINKEILSSSTEKMFDTLNFLYVVLIIAFGIGTVITVQYIIRPLRILVNIMGDIGDGNLGTRIPIKGNDEIWKVIRKFNEMVEKLEEYYDLNQEQNQQYLETQKMRWRAEMETLESYINSHFIFNTLNFINYQAIEAGNNKISTLIKKLSNIMRYAFNNRLKYIYLYQEIMWLEQYLYLQRKCMGDKLNFDISLDDEIASWPFRKMLLQPFVENSIMHGIKKCGGGVILIDAVRYGERHIRIQMSDNGCGMTEEKLREVRYYLNHPEEKKGGGIGLCNVAARIYYFFGKEAEIRVESEKGTGTKFILILPYPEGMDNVSDEERKEIDLENDDDTF